MHACNSLPCLPSSRITHHTHIQSHGCILNLTLPAIYQPFGNRLPTRTIQKALAVCIRLRSCVRYRYISDFDRPGPLLSISSLHQVALHLHVALRYSRDPTLLPSNMLLWLSLVLFPLRWDQGVLIGIGSLPAGDSQKPFDTCPICWNVYACVLRPRGIELPGPGYESFRIFVD